MVSNIEKGIIMTEISTANLQAQTNIPQSINNQMPKRQVAQYPRRQISGYDVYWKREKRKNTGLIERLYNKIKNATGLGIGSKKVETDLAKVKRGEISQNDFANTVKRYNASQETSAQTFADLFSVGAAGLTYFGLRNEAKLHHAGKKLNEKFGSSNKLIDAVETAGGGLNLKTFKKAVGKSLAYMAKSKTKLAVFTAGMAALVGGGVKMHLLQLNRIGSEEFKTDKKDFNGARTPHDKMMYKAYKKEHRNNKLASNFRNFVSGAINGAMMPLSVIGGAIVGIPSYFLGNSLNRHFVGSRHSDKSLEGYANSFVNDGVTQVALGAATLIPMAKKGRFSAVFDKNLEKAFNKINAHKELIDNPYGGKTTYQQLNDMMFESPKVKAILEDKGAKLGEGLSINEKIQALSDENIFAVKLKQIQTNDSLAQAMQDNCPATRTLEEATKEIQAKLGKNYKVKVNMGTGTIAETYLVEAPDGKEVCVKMLKKGIDASKIDRDKQKFIDIINAQTDKTEAEKQYLIKNIEDLANGIKKEIDFENEMNAAKKLVNFTQTARVVKPIEVKDGLYVMEKAEGINLKKLMELNNIDSSIRYIEKIISKTTNEKDKAIYLEQLKFLKSEKEKLSTKYKDIMLTEKDTDYMIDEYMKVLIEQLYKTDAKGRTLHADIHPGNIFIDVKALKERKGKVFTLIDTGNTIDLTAEQAARSMRLTQFIEHGDTKDLAKYFIEDANLAESKLTKEEAEKKLQEALDKVFFDSNIRLNTMNNTEIIKLTSNIMKDLKIMPGDSQLNLEKARTSAEKSFESLLNIWFNEAINSAMSHEGNKVSGFALMGKMGKALKKISEYQELQQAQERKNLMQMIKSPKEFFRSQTNPNYKPANSEEYLIYHLKQDIKQDKMLD